ncbi:MAG TPA: hypothetical protein DDY78_21990 [Planctomycetales bacterium]|jgi:hypothetical protein|nr:hypothetical protein [Planctomycetales bacterium]
MRSVAVSFAVLAPFLPCVFAGEPCTSGLTPGKKPGPYSSIVSVGSERGQSHCYICDTADHPAVVVFARHLSDPLGKLVIGLDKAIAADKVAGLRAWVTFLSDDQTALDPKIVEWGKKYAVHGVPLGVFENLDGPPSYRLSRDADVTVLLFVNRKVVVNFAFREAELTEVRAADVLKALPGILPAGR